MKDLILKILKKSLAFITIAILTWIIGEIFRPVYYAAISAMGQAGNFFVNTYYTCAAQASLSAFIGFWASSCVGFLLPLFFFTFLKRFKRIREIESSKREIPSAESILKWLKPAKVLLIIYLCLGAFIFVNFFMYILLPFRSKINFDYKITILKAVVTQEQICKLNARWRLMRSKGDYLKLMDDIKTIEEKHKAELENLSVSRVDYDL
ncbi:MAG: hypothetical protein J5862_03975 [Bacteroidales bacterium]|nr:hypothetical protein [Bacteroidales bacterium]